MMGTRRATQTQTIARALVLLNLGRAPAHTQRTHERHNEQQQRRCSRQPHRRGTTARPTGGTFHSERAKNN